ncbi:MAG: hypothetical protein BRC53_00735 [Cyanobacteria bacterium SW_6_48_11]|nr:MAG: hypothetical protein BRC53_00735 [Cyanobacteria bacterium SW_6_48_11]
MFHLPSAFLESPRQNRKVLLLHLQTPESSIFLVVLSNSVETKERSRSVFCNNTKQTLAASRPITKIADSRLEASSLVFVTKAGLVLPLRKLNKIIQLNV